MKNILLTLLAFFSINNAIGQAFTGTGGAIPDATATAVGATVCFPVNVTGVGITSATNGLQSVCLNITHTFVGDLVIYLVAPDGMIVPLSINGGDDGVNMTNTCFTQTATNAFALADGTDAPFTGNWLPDYDLGYVNNGQNANGTWNLCIYDAGPQDVGSLVNFTLNFSATPAPPKSCGGNLFGSNRCDAARPICNTNTYCADTYSAYSTDTFPGITNAFRTCAGTNDTLRRDAYFKFVASAASVTFNFTTTNGATPNDSIGAMVFSGGCGSGSPVVSHGCVKLKTGSTGTLTATGLTPGTSYFIIVADVNQGFVEYSFSAMAGTNILNVSPSAPTICAGGPGVALTASGGNGSFTWSPATGLSSTTGAAVVATPAATQMYTVTTTNVAGYNCPTTRNVTVTVAPQPTTVSPSVMCVGETFTCTPSTGGSWVSSNTAIANITSAGLITALAAGSATFTFTNTAGCSNTSAAVMVSNPTATPTFNTFGPYCQGTIAPALPLTSTNGINGTWSPASINTSTPGTTTYTFTPANGQCAATINVNITVTTATVPTFNQIAAFCQGSVAPTLPATSTNGINGTWSPSLVNNNATTTYTFTPNSGQCATTATMTIVVNPVLQSTISCGAGTSSSIQFNWTNVAGATSFTVSYSVNGGTPINVGVISDTFYVATGLNTGDNVMIGVGPNGIGCFQASSTSCQVSPCVPQSLTLTTLGPTTNQTVCINTAIAPITYSIGGSATSATVSGLPPGVSFAVSGTTVTITGSPTMVGTYNYVVTSVGGCSTPASQTGIITVTNTITPTFAPIPSFCAGTAAPTLPITSTNGITGTWSPAVVSNTASGTYTFTPNAGQCGTPVTINITVDPATIPTFVQIPPVCTGDVPPVLPMMSTNGIAGTWSPAVVNTLVGATYTFTPNAGQCATNTTMLITVIPAVTPTFNLIPPFCEGGTAPVLPTTSLNGITGTWNPSVVSNAASGVYTFTPNVGQCATPTTLPVLVVPQPTLFLGNDTLVCNANSLVLDATSPIPLTTYLWNTGATSPTITVTAPGTYSVVTTNPIGCTATDSRNVAFGNSPQFSIGRDTVICPSQNIVLNTNITDPALGILWQDGSTGATFTVTQPGTYYADVTNNCGTTRKTVVVTKGVCKILVPNVFTPNNDGKNDVFKVGGGESVTNFHMRVFNRFGQILFESKQVQKGWDGRYDGVKQDVGAYIYYVIYTDPITGKVYNLKGTVMLVR